jgi:S-methylmethionine-dependent homocysteine/selenocysteine methylase
MVDPGPAVVPVAPINYRPGCEANTCDEFKLLSAADRLNSVGAAVVIDGARMIGGGCCGIGPGHIERLGREIKRPAVDI